jgi:hypothetical protein
MTALAWPDYIAPNSIDWWIEYPTKSGGQTILGNERIVATPAARWRASMTFRIWGTTKDPKRMLFWRALAAALNGRSGSLIIGPFDQLTPSVIDEIMTVAFSDGTLFSDGASFDALPLSGPLTLSAGAARGALSILVSTISEPQPGQYFGVGGTEMHIVTGVVWNGVNSYTVAFSPPLRAAWGAGTVLDFENPKCMMRLSADDTARQKITIGGVADVTLDLIEVF